MGSILIAMDVSELKLVNFKDIEEQNILISFSPAEFEQYNFNLEDIVSSINFDELFIDSEKEDDEFFDI